MSHSGKSAIIDSSIGSLTKTSITAWYTDVVHEVKPITEGFRLALSFNLVAAPGSVLPALPEANSGLDEFRHVLHKWQEEKYETYGDESMSPEHVSYILDHKYSKLDLQRGFMGLKGKDSHLVQNLRGVAEEQGFMILLASLTHTKSGYAVDSGYGYGYGSKRGRYGYGGAPGE